MLGIGTGIMNAAGAGAGGGGGGAQFDPCASLSGGRARGIYDFWDETALIYSGGGISTLGGPEATTEIGFMPSKDNFSTWDTWENLVASVDEELTDPSFDSPGGGNWTTTDCTISGGQLTFTGVSAAYARSHTLPSFPLGASEWVLVTVVLSSYTSGRIEIGVGTNSVINITPAVGNNYFWVKTNGGGTNALDVRSDTSTNELTAVVDSVSCKVVPGNHMYATTTTNALAINTDGNGIKYVSGVSDGLVTAQDITAPLYIGAMVMGQGNDVAQSSYDSLFSLDANDNVAFGTNPTTTGGVNYEQTLHGPGVTEIWRSGVDNGDELNIWEVQIDWNDTDAWEVWKNGTSASSGTLATPIDLTEVPGAAYRVMTSGNGADELNGLVYGLYIYGADGSEQAQLYDWLNSNTGETL